MFEKCEARNMNQCFVRRDLAKCAGSSCFYPSSSFVFLIRRDLIRISSICVVFRTRHSRQIGQVKVRALFQSFALALVTSWSRQ